MSEQVRERLRVALEKNTTLEEELVHTKEEVSCTLRKYNLETINLQNCYFYSCYCSYFLYVFRGAQQFVFAASTSQD